MDDVHPTSARWTHVALPCHDLDESPAWYDRFTPLSVLDRRADAHGSAAWFGHADQPEHPFVLVLVCPLDTTGPAAADAGAVRPPGHRGAEPEPRSTGSRQKRTRPGAFVATDDHDPPVGYVCALADPDGNLVEFSHDQGVYAKAREVWGGS